MAEPIDIFLLLPDVATIGQVKLQGYCDEWLQRPIARKFGIVQLNVLPDLLIEGLIDRKHAETNGDWAIVPIVELIDYIIDEHFQDAETRRRLHTQWRELRKQQSCNYEMQLGRVGNLWLTCKNPRCGVLMETPLKATEQTRITCPPCELVCPACGHSAMYDGGDLKLVLKD